MPRKARISIVPPSHGAPHHLHLHPQIQASILILRSIYCTCPSAYQDYSAIHVRTLCCQISDPHFYTHTHTHPHICTYMHTMVSQNLPPFCNPLLPRVDLSPKPKLLSSLHSIGGQGSELNQTVRVRSISGVSFLLPLLGSGCPAPSYSSQADRRHSLCSTQRRLGLWPCFALL